VSLASHFCRRLTVDSQEVKPFLRLQLAKIGLIKVPKEMFLPVGVTSESILKLIQEPRDARFFVLVSLEGCKPCTALHDDIKEGALDGLNIVMHSVQTDLSSDDDIELVSLLQSGEFPLLALIEEGKVSRRWAGYFDLEPPERGTAFRALIAAAWGQAS
jgi:hypothetical protein